jgi:SAM-dependent methyltransferase
MKNEQDAFGHALRDQLAGHDAYELVERDDGYIAVSARAGRYFDPPEQWPEFARSVLERMNGRVLDVGCGAGRVALALQDRGHDVVGIDISPLAIEVCRLRGVKDARVMPVHHAGRKLGEFDTIAMMGNNFGLFGNARRMRSLLDRFDKLTSAGGRIVAEILDPYRTTDPQHLEYHERNRRKGRLAGQLRIRVRYKRYRTRWFDYLFVSRSELESLLAGTNWHISEILESGGPVYVAILEKSPVTI